MLRPGVAALAAAVLMASPVPSRAGAVPDRPNIVLVVLDTARRDHFSTYGYGKETTPAFTALAAEGIRFDRAYSTSAWTVPAHASLFTGLYPAAHGATQETQFLADDAVALAELLSAAGYRTASFSGNPWISDLANLAQGFDEAEVFWLSHRQPEGTGLPHGQNTRTFRWLDGGDPSRPFFLFVNVIEPHWRYQAPAELQRRFVPGGREVSQDDEAIFPAQRAYLRPERIRPEMIPVRTGMYDADLAYADAILGELWDGLRERGLLDDALVVVTSDHGENHGDGGHYGHMFSLNEALIRVPLAIRLPGGERAGTVRDDPVQLPDLFATVLAAAGLPVPELPLPAYDLLAESAPATREVLVEYYYPSQVLDWLPKRAASHESIRPFLRRIRALVSGNDKLVWGSDDRIELFDLAADPTESSDVAADRRDRAERLELRLADLVARCEESALELRARDETAPMDPATAEQLRALGYLR